MRKSCDWSAGVLKVNKVRCAFSMYLVASCVVGVFSGG